MARDAYTVAAELIELVQYTKDDPDTGKKLLAEKLEAIYDCAFALGFEAGKQSAELQDRPVTAALAGADKPNGKAAAPAPAAAKSNGETAKAAPRDSENEHPAPKRKLYGLPCGVCGALYTEDECPVCAARARAAAEPNWADGLTDNVISIASSPMQQSACPA